MYYRPLLGTVGFHLHNVKATKNVALKGQKTCRQISGLLPETGEIDT
jgi:hypothetical protein